ncbi:MAG: hypothetical protein AAGF31_05200 [Planctomycetota bacterium]
MAASQLCIAEVDAQSDPSLFANVINVPADIAPDSVGAGTQLNLFSNGQLPRGFVLDGAPMPAGSAAAGEVNIFGGQVRSDFTSNSGVLNIRGGTFSSPIVLFDGTVATIYGNDFRLNGAPIAGLTNPGDAVPFDLVDLPALGPTANSLTGILADGTPFAVTSADADDISPGVLTLRAVDLPEVVPGVINASTDQVPAGIRGGQVLNVDAGATVNIDLNVGPGGVVNLEAGGALATFEVFGGVVNVRNDILGTTGFAFPDAFAGSTINLYEGEIRGLDLLAGATLNYFGGSTIFLDAFQGSTINVRDGVFSAGNDELQSGIDFRVTGGVVEDLPFFRISSSSFDPESFVPSSIFIGGGTVNDTVGVGGRGFLVFRPDLDPSGFVRVPAAAQLLTITGGTINGNVSVSVEATAEIVGLRFVLDGVDITDTLSASQSFLLQQRGGTLSGILSDGSPFSFDLNPVSGSGDFFSPDAQLFLTLAVPEPATAWAVVLCLLPFARRRC